MAAGEALMNLIHNELCINGPKSTAQLAEIFDSKSGRAIRYAIKGLQAAGLVIVRRERGLGRSSIVTGAIHGKKL